jgi:AraC-like DNA-binding protein
VYPCHFEEHSYAGFEASRVFDVIYGGHFEHRLLTSKRSTMLHRRLILGDFRIETGYYNFPVIAQGAMPDGSMCIGFVAEGGEVTRYNTQAVGPDQIQLYRSRAELMYHAVGPSRWITFTGPVAAFERIAEERAGRPLPALKQRIATYQLPRGGRAHLRQLVDDAFAMASAHRPAFFTSALAEVIAGALGAAYIDALLTSESLDARPRTATAQRHHQLILACERIFMATGLSIDIEEMSRRSGYSRRSLELIFHRGVGMTPSRWFLNIRLNGALRELLVPGPACSVTDVAMRWGFRHLSRFAEHYCRAFGELPSQTLARARMQPVRDVAPSAITRSKTDST